MQKSPWFFVGQIAFSVFAAETLIMLVFMVLPELPKLLEAFVDSTLLSLLITPSLYLFLYRPLTLQIKQCSLIEKELRESQAQLKHKAEQLEQTLQKLQLAPQLLMAEKMSSLGRTVAGVAHEINNPVNFIYGNLTHVSNYFQGILSVLELYQKNYPHPTPEIENLIKEYDLEYAIEDLPKILSSMQTGTERIRSIVLTLRNFSRLDEAEKKVVNIHDGIDSTLLLLQKHFKSKPGDIGIEVVKEYDDLPAIECYPGRLNQVFMNLLQNAIDALEEHDKEKSLKKSDNHHSLITIRTTVLNTKWVQISIKDNGPGMAKEMKERIFEPFFTTKPVGEGTGLGLSISYQIIVNMHHGKLKCISAPNQGSEFLIEIPQNVDLTSKQVTSNETRFFP
ncbi:HAMP domain-containing histidine kinase [Aetokthonos hydrillicola Thurmond2011]|jgi:signal transduction histidine kinase|uniref:histidine kinase n=1 Tax=Aetokthonos hydrillicola Thurmond2011 TaxID=2712845 RepID=A0AAP5ICC6_9CYAN|nr:ATP-binding protein [Aetokthonos hydrillicola]MBO3461103.1 HAMP domain-containing histidine kinase [Aetokthonos hydrillicola CCALA 1050]MBW4590676.1 HAMP domain-containing histidine kinase [Aetokthonos hydrillicola CCALA 1050]MDR9897654.1 HAMP domain-containing histidine kinase [Aetokthonos hydrillicola Thurmond2011]